ncbi:hypothetical protein ABPG72_008122 [Tetrahymena utriculariae]
MQRKKNFTPTNKQNKYQNLDDDDEDQLNNIFNLFDIDGQGKIDPQQLLDILKQGEYSKKNPILVDIFQELIEKQQKLNNEAITVDIFKQAISQKLQEKNTKAGAEKIFQLFQPDNRNTISIETLKKIVDEIDENITQDELKDFIYNISQEGNSNYIHLDDFRNAMMKSNQ